MYNTCNPCNIRFSPANNWQGQTGRYKGFCTFKSLYYGYRAFFVLCRTYFNKCNVRTVQEFVSRFAPANENNAQAYYRFVACYLRKFGFDCTFNLEFGRMLCLAKAVTKFENGSLTSDAFDALNDACHDVFGSLL